MTLSTFRSFCNACSPRLLEQTESHGQEMNNTAAKEIIANEEIDAQLPYIQLQMFLNFYDDFWLDDGDMELVEFETLAMFYTTPPTLSDDWWDHVLSLSWKAFHSMYVDLARRSPRTVWNHLFAFRFNGFLDWSSERSDTEVALSSRGRCLNCRKPATTHLTRSGLICSTCNTTFFSQSDDELFVCC